MTARVRHASGLTDNKRLVARVTAAVQREVGWLSRWSSSPEDDHRSYEAAAIRVLGIVERHLERAKRARKVRR